MSDLAALLGLIPDHYLWSAAELVRPTVRRRTDRRGRAVRAVAVPASWLMEVLRPLVVARRSSRVELPAELLGLLVYGGRRETWPRDWRSVVMTGWRRQTRLPTARGRPKAGALTLAIPPQLLVSVQQFALKTDAGVVSYDFRNKLNDEEAARRKWELGERLKRAGSPAEVDRIKVEAGRVRVGGLRFPGFRACYAPARVFGVSPLVGLTRRQAVLLDALTYEVCRTRKRTGRTDRARIWDTEARRGRPPTAPPWLHGRYVAFNGNGKRHFYSRGYRIARRMRQAGYAEGTPARAYLDDLTALVEPFALVVAGYTPGNQRWHTLAELRQFHRSPAGRGRLAGVLVRMYTAPDYLTRWRAYMTGRILAGAPAIATATPTTV